MKIKIGKMILMGIISALLYIGAPLLIIYLLESVFNILTFDPGFTTSIIIFGIIGTVLAIIQAAFPKDTVAYHIVAMFLAIYSGVFLFYIFGGFGGGTFGNYYIDTALPGDISVQALFGLAVFAWLSLAGAGLKAVQHMIQAIEFGKQRKFEVKVKKKFKVSSIFRVSSIILSLAILGFIISIVISGINISPNIHSYDFGWDDGGTPIDPSDDTLNMTVIFDLANNGIYPIRNINIDVEILTVTSANTSALPENIIIGEVPGEYVAEFPAFSTVINQSITIDIDPLYTPGLLTTDAVLAFKIAFIASYAWINFNLNITINFDWVAPI